MRWHGGKTLNAIMDAAILQAGGLSVSLNAFKVNAAHRKAPRCPQCPLPVDEC
jgi:hypothetical protein